MYKIKQNDPKKRLTRFYNKRDKVPGVTDPRTNGSRANAPRDKVPRDKVPRVKNPSKVLKRQFVSKELVNYNCSM